MISSENKPSLIPPPPNPPVLSKSHPPPPPLYIKSEKIKELEGILDKLKHDYLLFRSYLIKSSPKHISSFLSKMSEIVTEYNNIERELGIELSKEKKKINYPKPPSTPPPSNSVSNAFYNEYSSIKTTMKNNADKYNEIMSEIQKDSNNYMKYKDTLKSLEESTNILEERLRHLSSSPTTNNNDNNTPVTSLSIQNNENDSLIGYDNLIKEYHSLKLKLDDCNEDNEEKEKYQKQLKEIEDEINKMNNNNFEEDNISSEKLFKNLIINATGDYHLREDTTNSEVINYLENYYKNHVPSQYLNDKLFMNYYIKASFDIITKSKENL